jgi:hypothetical protein
MARSVVSLLFGVTLCLGVSSCATRSASLNAFSDPGFHGRSINPLAIFPVRNARVSPGEAQELNRRISAGIASACTRSAALGHSLPSPLPFNFSLLLCLFRSDALRGPRQFPAPVPRPALSIASVRGPFVIFAGGGSREIYNA